MVITVGAYYINKYSDHIFSLNSTLKKQSNYALVKQSEFIKLHLWWAILNITVQYYIVLPNYKSIALESQSLKNKRTGGLSYKL